MKQRLHNQVHQ